jgi:outer membrane protein assembly factor BamD
VDKYPQSAFLKDAEKMYDKSNQELERITKLEAEQKALLEKEKSNTSKLTTSPQ